MASSLSTSIAVTRKSFNLLRSDSHLILYPLVSMIGIVVVAVIMLILISGLRLFVNVPARLPLTFGQQFGIFLIFIVFYILNAIICTISNAAVIGATMLRLEGEKPTVRDGFKLAATRLPLLVGYAALNATLGLPARGIAAQVSDEDNLAVSVVGSLVGTSIARTWHIIPYMVIPVIIAENLNLFSSMRRSATLFRETVGPNAKGRGGLGILFVVLALLAAIPGCWITLTAVRNASSFMLTFGFLLTFLLAGFVSLMIGATNSILQASLYFLAIRQGTDAYLSETDIRDAFETG